MARTQPRPDLADDLVVHHVQDLDIARRAEMGLDCDVAAGDRVEVMGPKVKVCGVDELECCRVVDLQLRGAGDIARFGRRSACEHFGHLVLAGVVRPHGRTTLIFSESRGASCRLQREDDGGGQHDAERQRLDDPPRPSSNSGALQAEVG